MLTDPPAASRSARSASTSASVDAGYDRHSWPGSSSITGATPLVTMPTAMSCADRSARITSGVQLKALAPSVQGIRDCAEIGSFSRVRTAARRGIRDGCIRPDLGGAMEERRMPRHPSPAKPRRRTGRVSGPAGPAWRYGITSENDTETSWMPGVQHPLPDENETVLDEPPGRTPRRGRPDRCDAPSTATRTSVGSPSIDTARSVTLARGSERIQGRLTPSWKPARRGGEGVVREERETHARTIASGRDRVRCGRGHGTSSCRGRADLGFRQEATRFCRFS